MAFNRELSQLGHYIVVDDTTGKIAITSTTAPNVGIGTINPEYKLDILGNTRVGAGLTVVENFNVQGFSTFAGFANFLNDLYVGGTVRYLDGNPFAGGIGIGSTAVNNESGYVDPTFNRIGVGFTDINFVGIGLTVVGYGSTVIVDLSNMAVRAEATVPSLTRINSSGNIISNTAYLTDTSGGVFTLNLPAAGSKNPGDFIELHDDEGSWSINNLMVATQNNEQFINFSGLIDSPFACDVDGATVKFVWTGSYWRVFA